jgi:hypothetical protein
MRLSDTLAVFGAALARFGGLEEPIQKVRIARSTPSPASLAHCAGSAQDLQFRAGTHTIRNRNRPAKQVGN